MNTLELIMEQKFKLIRNPLSRNLVPPLGLARNLPPKPLKVLQTVWMRC